MTAGVRYDRDAVSAAVYAAGAGGVARAYGLPGREDFAKVRTRCPLHGGKDSNLVIYPSKGRLLFDCKSRCGNVGDVFAFEAQLAGLDCQRDFPEVVRLVAERFGVQGEAIPERSASSSAAAPARAPKSQAQLKRAPVALVPPPEPEGPKGPTSAELAELWGRCIPVTDDAAVAAYLEGRGLPPADVASRDLVRVLPEGPDLPSWAPFGGAYRLLSPVFGPSAELVSLKAWRVGTDNGPKRMAPRGERRAGRVFANAEALAMLRGDAQPSALAVVEGEPDTVTASLAWRELAVLGVEAGSWSPEVAAKVPNGCRVVVLTHRDPAGDKYAAEVAGSLRSRCLVFRGGVEGADLNEQHVAGTLPANPFDGAELLNAPEGITPDDVVKRWHAEGPLVHEPCGIPALDALTGGGPCYGTRWTLAGAPDAGKTALLLQAADTFVSRGVAVGLLAVDEEPGDLLMRFAQRRGLATREECEARSVETLTRIAAELGPLRLRFYDHTWTIERAAADVARLAAQHDCGGFLGVDSLQTVRCDGEDPTAGALEQVTARAMAVRNVATRHRLIVWATSEMNRGGYRNRDQADNVSDMAAAKGSGAIEYQARVLLSLRSVPGEGDLVELTVAKNKHGRSGGVIGLRLDRGRQTLTELEDYKPADHEAARKAAKRQAKREAKLADAVELVRALVASPGLSKRKTREAMAAALDGFTMERLDVVTPVLGAGLVLRPGDRGADLHFIDGSRLPKDVLERFDPAERAKVGTATPPEWEAAQ